MVELKFSKTKQPSSPTYWPAPSTIATIEQSHCIVIVWCLSGMLQSWNQWPYWEVCTLIVVLFMIFSPSQTNILLALIKRQCHGLAAKTKTTWQSLWHALLTVRFVSGTLSILQYLRRNIKRFINVSQRTLIAKIWVRWFSSQAKWENSANLNVTKRVQIQPLLITSKQVL